MNRFDFFIVIIFALMLFGDYGAGLQPIRVFTLLLTYVNFHYLYNFLKKKENLFLFFFSFFMVFYCLLSTSFLVDNISNSFLSFIYFFLNMLLFLNFLCCFNLSKNPFNSVQIGSLIFCCVSILFAIYEINTGFHLGISLDAFEARSTRLRTYSSFTFANYNTFILALMVNMPIISHLFIASKRIIIKSIAFILLLGMVYIIVINGSRSGLIAFIMTILYVIFSSKSILFRMFLCLFFLFFIFYLLSEFDFLAIKLSTNGLEDYARYSVIFDAFSSFSQKILGFGIGNFTFYTKDVLKLNSIVYAEHNFFMEILFELGVFSFIFFILFLFRIFYFYVRRKKDGKVLLIYMFSLFAPFSVINSGYLLAPIVWIFLGILCVYSSAWCASGDAVIKSKNGDNTKIYVLK